MDPIYHNLMVNAFGKIISNDDLIEMERNILSLYTIEEIPDVVYRIMDLTYDPNIDEKTFMKNVMFILDDNIYDTTIYKNEQNELKERDNFVSNPFTVEEGVMQCNKCGSKKTYSQSKQVRSADEGFSTFCMCANCGAKWRIN
jgi:DNA-directed RNA polymerase subunit M/transcription elongation factor TFIIS